MGILRLDDVLDGELHLGCARTLLLSSCKTTTRDDYSQSLTGFFSIVCMLFSFARWSVGRVRHQ